LAVDCFQNIRLLTLRFQGRSIRPGFKGGE
jgi:hypothetical protein